MLRSLNEIRTYRISAKDDEIGRVDDSLFDDREWVVRYVVVDTGKWLPGRLTLVSPVSIAGVDWKDEAVSVRLSREEIENGPSIEAKKPVSREKEKDLVVHFAWPAYWVPAGTFGEPMNVGTPAAKGVIELEEESVGGAAKRESHLRSVNEVTGYKILATDGKIGHMEDFITDDESWTIRYVVIDTRDWLPGKKVLISPEWVKAIIWEEGQVDVGMTKDVIKESPEFDPSAPVNREYETRLYDYYGRPKYWEQDES